MRSLSKTSSPPDAGYVAVEPEQITLGLSQKSEGDLELRVDFELIGAEDILRWVTNTSTKISTPNIKAFYNGGTNREPESEIETEGHERIEIYTIGLQMYERSSFLDLTDAVLTKLSNAKLAIKICRKNTEVAQNVVPTPTPAVKGKGAAAQAATQPLVPDEEILVEFTIPFNNMFYTKSSLIDMSESNEGKFNSVKITAHSPIIIPERTSIQGRLFADNDLSDFVAGALLLNWEDIAIEGLSVPWGLHPIEPPEGKVKVPPTEQELRTRYIDRMMAACNDQFDKLKFTFLIDDMIDSDKNDTDNRKWFSLMDSGRLIYEKEKATQIPLSDDIKTAQGLWSLKFDTSRFSLINRKYLREILKSISSGKSQWRLQLTRTPLKKGPENVEGEEMIINGTVDFSLLGEDNCRSAKLTGLFYSSADATEPDGPIATMTAKLNNPLRDVVKFPESKCAVADTLTQKGVAPGAIIRRDVMSELRAEIVSVIREVAHEYVTMYPVSPTAPPATTNGGINAPNKIDPKESELEARRAHFLHHLSSTGVYHALKERLKPRIQRVVRDKYGVRGRAIGKAGASAQIDADVEQNKGVEQLLGELYVFLVKESNIVLNGLFKSTMIARDEEEIDQVSVHVDDDEKESPIQIFARLLSLARDAELDGRTADSEQFHLERVQLVAHSVDLGGSSDHVYEAYKDLGEFMLRRAAGKWSAIDLDRVELDETGVSINNADEGDINGDEESRALYFVSRAQEALELAVAAKKEEFSVRVLLSCLLVEKATATGMDRAEIHLETAALSEIRNARYKGYGVSKTILQSLSLQEYDDYDSDDLSPINPLVCVAISLLFYQQRRPTDARKALRMAVRAYVDGDGLFQPPVSTHGKPRRSAVLILTQMSIYLSEMGFRRLSMHCLALARDNEAAATEKATERGLPATTPAFIRYLLRRAESEMSIAKGDFNVALELARESILLAESRTDIVAGWLSVAKCISLVGGDTSAQLDALVHAIQSSNEQKDDGLKGVSVMAPLEAYLRAGKLLINDKRFGEAIGMLISGCRIYQSPSLFLMLGISCFREERIIDAEDALQESNLLDCRRAEVWAYLALVCLSSGAHRQVEAERATAQALRLQLRDAVLLRELATNYMTVDQLQVTEDLIRRAMAIELEDKGSSSALTKKNTW
mmetsp:Transcript_41022/g.41900  ORF Transcript_41022/g.41900 Transcript_41022/m.41900 type:complete len:1165 (-) Transcript_41022:236-3730(-)